MMTELAILGLIPATAACLYYLVLMGLGTGHRGLATDRFVRRRIVVLIPAHNEELSLPDSLASIATSDSNVEVVVVADNCTDGTATVARRMNATVLERQNSQLRGKGYALAHGLEFILGQSPDAVLILDADCQVERDLFAILGQHLHHGHPVIQCGVITRNADDGPTGFVGAVGNQFDNLLSAGKDRLNWTVPLRGSGMCFHRAILEQYPWHDFGLTEDSEYTERLRAGGIHIHFEPQPLIRSESPSCQRDLEQQRRRWRVALLGGRGLAVQWLESKPLVLAQLAMTGGLVGLSGNLNCGIWFATIALLTGCLYGLVIWQVGLNRRRIGALLQAPWVVVRLAVVTLGGLFHRGGVWQRTGRAAELLQ